MIAGAVALSLFDHDCIETSIATVAETVAMLNIFVNALSENLTIVLTVLVFRLHYLKRIVVVSPMTVTFVPSMIPWKNASDLG